jgi:hypothetical protein
MPCLSPPSPRPTRLRHDGLSLGKIPGELFPEADEGPDAPLYGPDARTMRARRMDVAMELLRTGYEMHAVLERFDLAEESLRKAAASRGIRLR